MFSRFLILIHCIIFVGGKITLKSNGYDGIVVSIDEKVPESEELLAELKESFREASELLYTATKQQVYFGVIRIQLPSTWERITENITEYKSYATGDFIVDNPPAEHGNRPFTMQPFGCGTPGDFTVLPPGFFNNTTEQDYGPLYKVIVHEWGHLRFGLFDEYPVTPDQKFYISTTNVIEATKCSSALSGQIEDENGGQCLDALSKSTVCDYKDLTQSGSFASLMYKTNLQHIDRFCDIDTEDMESFHNKEAPNDQNRFCNGKSAWEVFRDHPDFNSTPAAYSSPPEVVFIPYKIRRARTILVMDTSGSMADKIAKMTQAVKLYLTQFLREGEEVGLVMFSSYSTKLHGLVPVSPTTIDELVASIPTVATGGTCIGCGIRAALEMLNPDYVYDSLPESNKGGTLIVLSDGEEGGGRPQIADVHREVIEQEVTLHSIALTNAADSNVDSLAIATGGRTFIYSYNEQSNALHEAFQTLNELDASPYNKNIQLKSEIEEIIAGGNFSDTIAIDSTIGKGTRFIFDYEGTMINIDLTSPTGTTYTEANADHSDSNIYIFSIEDDVQQSGIWSYTVINPSVTQTRVAVTVTSRASNPERPPIIAEPFWSHRDGSARIQTENQLVPILYVRVSQGYSPVVGATVKAFITTPNVNVKEVDLALVDEGGTDFDTYAGDGIYANYFMAKNGIGRYEVRIFVTTTKDAEGNEVTSIDHRRIIGRGAPTDQPETDSDTEKEAISDFQRVANVGAYNVLTEPERYDPARITTLTVVSVDPTKRVLVLRWTATGAELNVGTASYYELRYSSEYTHLEDDFASQLQVPKDQLVLGDLAKPLESGNEELFILNYPDAVEMHRYYAVVAYDTDGRSAKSAVSNIVKVTLAVPEPPPPPTPAAPNTQPDTTTQLPTSTPFVTTEIATEQDEATSDTSSTEGTTVVRITTKEDTTVIDSTSHIVVSTTTDTLGTSTEATAVPGLLKGSGLALIIGIPSAIVCITLVFVITCAVMYGSRKRRMQRHSRYYDHKNVRQGFDNRGYDYPRKYWKPNYAYP